MDAVADFNGFSCYFPVTAENLVSETPVIGVEIRDYTLPLPLGIQLGMSELEFNHLFDAPFTSYVDNADSPSAQSVREVIRTLRQTEYYQKYSEAAFIQGDASLSNLADGREVGMVILLDKERMVTLILAGVMTPREQ